MKSAEEFVKYPDCLNTDSSREIKARDLAMWKQGMTDAAACVRNNDKYGGQYWLPQGIEAMRDNTKSV